MKDYIKEYKIKKLQSGGRLKERLSSTIDPTSDINLGTSIIQVGNFLTNKKWDTNKDPVANAAWRKRLGLTYDTNQLPSNPDGSVRLPDNIASQIQTDTTAIKNRIKDYQNIINSDPNSDPALNASGNLSYLNNYLSKLRRMYKGEPVVVNEYEARKDAFNKHGYMNTSDTPLNLLRNFTLNYDPKSKQISYKDVYDFNILDFLIPGKSFEIKGTIPK